MYIKHVVTFLLASVALQACTAIPSAQTHEQKGHFEYCKATSEQEIAALFERWNQSLRTNDPHQVVANYAEHSILLPTLSNTPRLTAEQKEAYFVHFLENHPSGKIDQRSIELGCNMATDNGLYTFTFAKTGASVHARYSYTYRWDGEKWLIISHHSSLMPEKVN